MRRRPGRDTAFGFVLALGLLGLGLAPIRSAAEDAKPTGPAGMPAKLKTVDDRTLDLPALLARGPILLDFWATWCKPCIASLPEIEALHERHAARGLTVIGVSIDGPRNLARVRPFAQRLGLTYPIVFDGDGRLQELFNVRAVPTALLIGKHGKVIAIHEGYRPGEGDRLAKEIEALLAADSTDTGAAGR